MSRRYEFPDLSRVQVPEEALDPGAGFAPLFAGRGAPSVGLESSGEGWLPMVPARGSAGARQTGTQPSTPGLPPNQAATPPVSPARAEPRVDPRELERIRAQAREEGYREGLQRGEAEGRTQWLVKVERIEALLSSLGQAREGLFHALREDLVRIMTLVPRKLLRGALDIRPDAIRSIVGSVLEELPRQERVIVRVSPADLRFLEEGLPDLRRRLGGYTQVELESSHQVASGGAVIVTDGGRIDATLERQLETFELRAREWILGGSTAEVQSLESSTPYGLRGGEPG